MFALRISSDTSGWILGASSWDPSQIQALAKVVSGLEGFHGGRKTREANEISDMIHLFLVLFLQQMCLY